MAVLSQVLLPAAGCGGRGRAIVVPVIRTGAPALEESVFCPDEYLKWSLRWNGIEAASTEMVSGQPGEIGGEQAIIVYSLSRSSELAAIFREVREELKSQVSLSNGHPLRNESSFSEDGSSEALEVEFASESYRVQLREAALGDQWTIAEAGGALDVHSFLAQLRAWNAAADESASALVQNGRRHYRVDLAMGGAEVIETPEGRVPAIRIHGEAMPLRKDGKVIKKAKARVFTLWRSDDARALPLRFELETRMGDVRGTLVEYRQSETDECIQVLKLLPKAK